MQDLQQWLALLLLGLGVVAAGMALNSRLPLLGAIVMFLSGATLLVATRPQAAARVVLIADDDLADLDRRLREAGEHAGAGPCVVLLRSRETRAITSGWQSACLRGGAPAAPAVAALLSDALSRFEQLDWLEQLSDLLAGRTHRVVLLAGPSRLGAGSGATVAVAKLAARARDSGVSIDAPWSELREQELHDPKLVIEPIQNSAMALTNSTVDQFSFELRLVGAPDAATAMVSCEFGGSCQRDADCGTAAPRCARGHCSRECSSDIDCGSDDGSTARCDSGACVDEHVLEEVRALTARAVTPRPLGSDFSLGKYRLSDFKGLAAARGSNLSRGWHPLTCRAQYPSSNAIKLVDVTTYVLATNDAWAVVWGAGGHLTGSPEEKKLNEAARGLALNALIDSTSDLSSLALAGPPLEESALRPNEKLLPKLAAHTPLSLLLVSDASKAFWQAHCGEIAKFLEAGGNVVASLVPPAIPDCPLPAFAAHDPHGAFQDLQPRVTFVLDDSRVGRLAYRPLDPPQLEEAQATVTRPLLDGLDEVQVPIVRKMADELGWDLAGDTLRPRVPANSAPFFRLEIEPELAVARERSRGTVTTEQMASASTPETRLGRVPREAQRLGPQDLVVLFSYLVNTPQQQTGELGRILGSGARVIVVPIDTTFGGAFSKGSDLRSIVSSWQAPPDAAYRTEPRLRNRLLIATPTSVVPTWGAPPLSLAAKDVDALAQQLIRQLRALYAPEAAASIDVKTFHRFIDWRLGIAAAVPPQRAALQAHPLRVQKLVPNTALQGDASQLLTRNEPARGLGALNPMPLAYGSIHGQGHLLVLGYSLFDGIADLPLRDPLRSRVSRLFQGDEATELGANLFARFAGKTDRLLPLANDRPRLQGIHTLERRFVQLDVSQRSRGGVKLDALYLTEAGQCSPEGLSGASAASLGLVGIDPKHQRSTFLLSPLQRMRLCKNQACAVSLCRKMCTSAADNACELQAGSADIFLEPASVVASKPTENLPLSRQLDWLRVLSGGSDVQRKLVEPGAHSRPFASLSRLLAMAAVAAFLVARVMARRRAIATHDAPARRPKPADASHGLLRGSAETLGLPLPSLPAGAFAGFRPLEAGDSLRSVERRGLLASMRLDRSGLSTIPQVALRVDTSPRSVLVLVDASASMAIRSHDSEAPKLVAARRVTALLAELARSLNAQMLVRAFGVDGAPIEAGGINQNLTRREVESFFDRLTGVRHQASWASPPVPEEAGLSVIVLSDFIGKDVDAIGLEVERIQAEGSAVGVFLIASRADLARTHVGWLAGTRILSDRSHLDVAQLRQIHHVHQTRTRTALADARGGVTLVQAEISDVQLLSLVMDGPAVELLR